MIAFMAESDSDSDSANDLAPDYNNILSQAPGPAIPARGIKSYEPQAKLQFSQAHALERSRDAMFKALSQDRLGMGHKMSTATWDEQTLSARVETMFGSQWTKIGFQVRSRVLEGDKVVSRSHLHLYPEETLAMVERGSLALKNGQMPLSLEGVWSLVGRHVDLKAYLVYGTLKRLGYTVQRSKESVKRRNWAESLKASFRRGFRKFLDWQVWIRSVLGLGWSWSLCYSYQESLLALRGVFCRESGPLACQDLLQTTWAVWKPSTVFKKSQPPDPDLILTVLDANAPVPTLPQLQRLWDGQMKKANVETKPVPPKSLPSQIKLNPSHGESMPKVSSAPPNNNKSYKAISHIKHGFPKVAHLALVDESTISWIQLTSIDLSHPDALIV